MPNWCEGQLKIRGNREDITSFLENELVSVDDLGNELKYKFHKETNGGLLDEVYIDTTESHYSFWIKNTRRAFIDSSVYCYFYGDENRKQIALFDFVQAWHIKVEELENISKKYNIDFKIYGFERFGEFNQDVEIINGVVIKDEIIKFNDYRWECTNPNLGG